MNPLHDFLFSAGEGAELVALHQDPTVMSLVPSLEMDQHLLRCLVNFLNFRGVPGKNIEEEILVSVSIQNNLCATILRYKLEIL